MNTNKCYHPKSMNRRFNGFFSTPIVFDSIFGDLLSSPATAVTKAPAINIRENDKEFVIELVAPGFEKEEIKLNLEDKKLKISGDKSEGEKEQEIPDYTRREFKAGKFERNFVLPDNIDCDEIKAEFKNGILFISIPKKVETKKEGKQITIE